MCLAGEDMQRYIWEENLSVPSCSETQKKESNVGEPRPPIVNEDDRILGRKVEKVVEKRRADLAQKSSFQVRPMS